MPMDQDSFYDPLHKVLMAQANNLLRIAGPGTRPPAGTVVGSRRFIGPTPDMVLVAGDMERLIQYGDTDWKRRFIIQPVAEAPEARVAHRADRQATYLVIGLVKLVEVDQETQAAARGANNLMALAMDALAHDFKLAFYDDLTLEAGDCQLVVDADFTLDYAEPAWPIGAFNATVTCSLAQTFE